MKLDAKKIKTQSLTSDKAGEVELSTQNPRDWSSGWIWNVASRGNLTDKEVEEWMSEGEYLGFYP